MRAEAICLIFALAIVLVIAKPSIQNVLNEIVSDSDKNPCLSLAMCGANAICTIKNGKAVCSCPPDYTGDPTVGCRTKCNSNIECASNMSCINHRCNDSCQAGTCGHKADCKFVNHIPICSCPPSRTGDPFTYCKPIEGGDRNPCYKSPCGENSRCSVENFKAICSCLPGHVAFSDPTVGCKPECTDNSECANNLVCTHGACENPCNVCGSYAQCNLVNGIPICLCPEGMTGNPFLRCHSIDELNACTTDSDCQSSLACYKQKCISSCVYCGIEAQCNAANHTAICTCPEGMTGNPFLSCQAIGEKCAVDSDCPSNQACIKNTCTNPCPSSLFGKNSRCDVVDHIARYTCLDGLTGNPHERCDFPHGHDCTGNSFCASDQVCFNQTCKDPCPEICAKNAQCDVRDHFTKCTCPDGMSGNPYTNGCTTTNACVTDSDCASNQVCSRQKCTEGCPDFCGKNAKCDVINQTLSCTCPEGMNGDPYKECQIFQNKACITIFDCASNEDCRNGTCTDPCVDEHCGADAVCFPRNRYSECTCPPGMTGNPYDKCIQYENVCSPSPCGPYSQCTIMNEYALCSCLPGYAGSPPFCKDKNTPNIWITEY